MSEAESALPFHLRGNFAPVFDERDDRSLEVEGAIPPELNGLFLRNGANPSTGKSAHWFLGDGMVHGLRLENGRASWYRNRYVQTPSLCNPSAPRISDQGVIDHANSKANTHVLRHAGRILALEEGSYPYEIDFELDTVGPCTFGGIDTAFTAHPHVCPETGEMIGFGYSQFAPYLTYYRIGPKGEFLQREDIDVPGPTMIHDFMISRKYAIFMDLPVVFDLERAMQGTMPFHWSDDYGARIGLMPREGTNAEVRWFEIDPCYIFHTVNAWDIAREEGGIDAADGTKGGTEKVVFDVCRISEMWRDDSNDLGMSEAEQTLHRFEFDLTNDRVTETTLDDRAMDFPRIADDRVGLPNRHAYTLRLGDADAGTYAGHLKFDLESGQSEFHDYGRGLSPGEPVFVATDGATPDSDEGYVLSYLYDDRTGKSEIQILDATRFEAAPLATIKLPVRVPFGFHGSWVAQG